VLDTVNEDGERVSGSGWWWYTNYCGGEERGDNTEISVAVRGGSALEGTASLHVCRKATRGVSVNGVKRARVGKSGTAAWRRGDARQKEAREEDGGTRRVEIG